MSDLNETNPEIQPEGLENPVNETPQTPPAAPQTPPTPTQTTSMFDAPRNYSVDDQPAKPNNNLVLAIIATAVSLLTCCGYVSCLGFVLGIVAIVFATQVTSKYNVGDFDGAEKAAKNSKLCSFIALGTVAASIIWIIISIIMYGGFGAMQDAFTDGFNKGLNSY